MEAIKQMITSIDINRLLTIFDIQIAIGIALFFIIFRTAFSKLVIRAFYLIIKSKRNPKNSTMFKVFNGFFIVSGLYIAVRIINNNAQLAYFANKVYQITIAYCISRGIVSQLTDGTILVKKLFGEGSRAVDKLLCKILRAFVWLVFLFVVANLLGFNLSGLGGVVTGLGVVSAVAALAAQDLVKSLLSGFVILTDKPFVIGDWISVGDYEGTVIDITFRSVRLKSYNNAIVTIPNSLITECYVSNWNRLTSRRFDCTLGLSLNTSTEHVRRVVKEIRTVLKNNEDIISDTVNVNISDISTGSINIKIYLYIKRTEYAQFLKVKQDIYCSLLYLMEKENIELVSFPTQTVYLNRKDEETAEE